MESASLTASVTIGASAGESQTVNSEQLQWIMEVYNARLKVLEQSPDYKDNKKQQELQRLRNNIQRFNSVCINAIAVKASDDSFRLFSFDALPDTFTCQVDVKKSAVALANIMAVSNKTEEKMETSVQLDYELTQTVSTTFTVGVAVGVQATFSVGVPLLAKTDFTVSLDLSFEYSSTNSETRTSHLSVQQPLVVPPNSTRYVSVWITPLTAVGNYSCNMLPAFTKETRKTPIRNMSVRELIFDTLEGTAVTKDFSLALEQQGILCIKGGVNADVRVSAINPTLAGDATEGAFA